MAQVRVMYWKEIPYAVRATDDAGQVSRQLPAEFNEAIDQAAMNDGDTDALAYQAGFRWTTAVHREGGAATAADAVVAEIVKDYPRDRLDQIAARRKA